MKRGKKMFTLVIIVAIIAVSGYFIFPDLFHDHRGEETLYTCPMHPQIVQDRPGDCPICGMRLVPVRKEEKKEAVSHDGHDMAGLTAVTIDPARQALMGITFEKAEKRKLIKEIRTTARILPDETRLFKVSVKVGGWIEKLFVNQTGQFVKRGSPLFSLYSPELFSAQQEYLSALRAAAALKDRGAGAGFASASVDEVVRAARERLRLFDISAAQIARIGKNGEAERTLILYSPASGYIQEKKVFPGQKVMPNDELFIIADLSRVWGESDIFETDLPYVKAGMPVEITLPYWVGKSFRGRISFLDPFLDPDTRALKARLEIPNADLTLKPNMFGDAKISYSGGVRVSVSEGSVMRTGTRDYVFVKKSEEGHILPVEVKLGLRSSDGYFEVREGVKEGDVVVSSANFLVDSESAIKAALKAASGGHNH